VAKPVSGDIRWVFGEKNRPSAMPSQGKKAREKAPLPAEADLKLIPTFAAGFPPKRLRKGRQNGTEKGRKNTVKPLAKCSSCLAA